MKNHITQLRLVTLLLYLLFLFTAQIINGAAANPAYTAAEHILLNCGSSSKLNSYDGQSWDGDVGTKFSPDINTAAISFPANATEQDPSLSSTVPYTTARIILSRFSYTFPLSPGQKIIRLYFNPATYSKRFFTNQSFFTVTANQYTLLGNFSAFLAVSQRKPWWASLVKEFIITVGQTRLLNVTLFPSANSYAFVNGIEIVSIPDNLYMGSHGTQENELRLINSGNSFYMIDNNKTAFENLYRLNVGGQAVSAMNDAGIFREWLQDDNFISGERGYPWSNSAISPNYDSQTPIYSAPAIIYTTARFMGLNATFNLTWMFPVDSGFFYLLRLHFCEIMPFLINSTNQRVFTIFMNNMLAEPEADVIRWAASTGIPVFKDYIVSIPNPSSSRSTQQLFLTLRPNHETGAMYLDAILNGLEIFKLSSIDGNLAGSNPEIVENSNSSKSNSKREEEKRREQIRTVFPIVGGAAGLGAIILILGLLVRRRWRGVEQIRESDSRSKSSWVGLSSTSRSTKTNRSGGSSCLPSHLCRHFFLQEIKSATANFDDTFMIGKGGFGKVYRGNIGNTDPATVAIKRLDPSSRQGAHEFQTEIEMLSKLRHVHLVSLIGYCAESGEMILVYEYMANGSLRDHLHGTENPPLTWKQRLQICIDAAKGLHYLHSGAKQNIIHRDVKTTNILLDEKCVAKVSDFGLCKLGSSDESHSHVSTKVKGSFGYMDPEYIKKRQLTDKSDVYSFGVVLFEVLCGRPAVLAPNSPVEEANLAHWAQKCYRRRTIGQIVDPNLKGQIAPECFQTFCEVAIDCLKEQGVERPTMNDVVWKLEYSLKLQEDADREGTTKRGDDDDDDTEAFLTSSSEINIPSIGMSSGTSEVRLSSSNACTTIKLSESDFSELNSIGR